jgi:hypothetical protein
LGTLDLDMQALATTIFLRRNKRNPKLPTAMHWSGEDCTNVAHCNAFCTKIIQFWKMSFKKIWTQFQQEIKFFTLPKLTTLKTKKPYLIKGQHFRVFEKNSGFRVQVQNWVMNVPCGTWLLQSKCRELHRWSPSLWKQ